MGSIGSGMRTIVKNHRSICAPLLVNIVTFFQVKYLCKDMISKVFLFMCVKHWGKLVNPCVYFI